MLLVQARWQISCSLQPAANVLLLQHVFHPSTNATAIRYKSSKPRPQNSSDSYVPDNTMGKKSKITRGGGGRGKQPSDSTSNGHGKPTHFLCFPIASDSTIHQISASRTHWMDVTTRPVSKIPRGRRRVEIENPSGSTEVILELGKGEVEAQSNPADMGGKDADETTPNTERPTRTTLAESLQILPPIVTRAAGTWHLTLGVMNLADEARMKLALEVLEGLDLQSLLSEAEKGPPVGYKKARQWEDRRADHEASDTNIEDAAVAANSDSVQSAEVKTQDQTPPRLTIALTGLGGFPSLKNARVLWARPREQLSARSNTTNNDHADPTLTNTNRLYNFALHIIQPFRDAGLITETRSLALHATVANMRFAKSRGRVAAWRCDRVDAGRIGRVWNGYRGMADGVDEAGLQEEVRREDGAGAQAGKSEEVEEGDSDAEESAQAEESDGSDATREFVWVKDVDVNRVAICKLGATKHEDSLWREWYPPIEGGERLVFEEGT